MLLFGCHPFLFPADLVLCQAEQIVKLIDNTLNGQLQLPIEAVDLPATRLLRRILNPDPKQRLSIQGIMADPWFQVNLPPGALRLNSCFPQDVSYYGVKQTPLTIKQMIDMAAEGTMAGGSSSQATRRLSSVSSQNAAGQSSLQQREAEAAAVLQQLQLRQQQEQQQRLQQQVAGLDALLLGQQPVQMQQGAPGNGLDGAQMLQQLWQQRQQQSQEGLGQDQERQWGSWLQEQFQQRRESASLLGLTDPQNPNSQQDWGNFLHEMMQDSTEMPVRPV